MNIKMEDVFTSTTGVCIHVNLSCLHDFMNDGVTPFDMIDKAVSEYDANQALIAKQAEQIKMLRSVIEIAINKIEGLDQDAMGAGHMQGVAPWSIRDEQLYNLSDALEATKEQA